jgi:hypothetical protein
MLNILLGSGNDTFTILRNHPGIPFTLNAGGGNDTINVGQNNLTGIFGSLALNGGAGSNTLNVNDRTGTADQTYTLDGNMLAVSSGPLAISYAAMQNLTVTGGAGNDVVAVRSDPDAPLTLNGGGGWNALDYSAYPADVYVNLQTGAATGMAGVANVQQVTGGAGNDILVGSGGNVLDGGAGNDVLIAGWWSSVLVGGEGDDLLIGGVTAYDGDDAALAAIRDYWAGPDDYATRAAGLAAGEGVPLLDATTVFANGGGNTLLGGDGLDLFFGSPDLDAHDWDPAAEQFVALA